MEGTTPMAPPANGGSRSKANEHLAQAAEQQGFLAQFAPMFRRLKQIDDRMTELDAERKGLVQETDELTEQLSTVMDDNLVSRITFEGTTFFRRNDKYPKVKDQDELFKWLHEIDRGDMIKPVVNAQTLRSLVLELDREHQEFPPCLEVFEKKRVQMRA